MVTIQYSDGSAKLGWILSLAGASMRVAIEDQEDSAAFRLVHGMWLSEQGDEVTFRFSVCLDDATELISHIGEMQDAPRPSACAGGGDCVFRQLARTRPS
jgi:hypothetical protein